jgi:hypothetical protein
MQALLFQAGWLGCVAGGNRGALAVALLILPLHAWLFPMHARAWATALAIAGAGLALDLVWQASGVIHFAHTGPGALPPWLALLWLLLSLSLFHSLAWLQERLWIATILGALAGPLSYLAGLRLGAAQSPLPEWQFACLLAPAWAMLLPVLALAARQATRATPVRATT